MMQPRTWMSRRHFMRLGMAGTLWVIAAGCAPVPASPASLPDERLRVVTTVAPLTNIVYNVSGDAVSLHGLVPPGVNSHTFEPSPSDARELADADVVFLNGLQLEALVMDLVAANADADVRVIELGDMTLDAGEWVFDFSYPESGSLPNPHLWMNPQLTIRYVEVIRDVLSEAAPELAEEFAENGRLYLARLQELDAAIAAAMDTIPADQRRLLTYHDSWAYFGPHYGLALIGAVQPSDLADPSPRELAALIQQIRDENVSVIFGSQEFPSSVLEVIARETGARLESSLSDDVLPGEPGAPEHTYVGMMVRNARIITEALGGDASALDAVRSDNISADSG